MHGKWVYTKLLCGQIGDPPANVPKLPTPRLGEAYATDFAMHRAVAPCKGCHA